MYPIMKTKKDVHYRCPRCKSPVKIDSSNPFRPFCSDRCKLIDLGNWASESYKIPTTEQENLNDSPLMGEDENEDI